MPNPVETTARGDDSAALDTAQNPPIPKRDETEEDFIARVKKGFARALDAESENRQQRRDDLLFVRLGGEHQWPDYARAARGEDRPMLTDNRVKQFRTAVINNLRQNTPSAKVLPADDKADKRTAQILGGLIRNIEQTTGGDIAKDKATEFAVDTGLGYFGIMPRYVSDDSWDQEVAYRTIEDPFRVYFDPDSILVDGSDATRAWLITDLPKPDYERETDDDSVGDWQEGDGDGVIWDTDHTRRICEYFEVRGEPATLYLLDTAETVWEDGYQKMVEAAQATASMPPQVVKRRKATRKRCHWYKLSSTKILEETVLPTSYVPIFPVYGEEFWHEGRHHIEGLVRQAKDPQRLYNFWLSCVAEQIALQPKIPFILPEGSQEADENWATANVENHPYLLYRWRDESGNIIPAAPSREAPPPIPTGYTEQMGVSLEGIKAAVGMSNPAVGAQESANQSGKALRTLQAAAMIGTSHFGDNLGKSVAHAGRVIIEMIQGLYDVRRVQRILGEDGTPDHVVHDPAAETAYQERPNPQGGVDKIYNLGVGRYDVVVSVGPTYASRREEGFEVITQLAQVAPQIMQVAGDYVARLSDNPYADQIAERIKATIPPQILAATETETGEPPDPRLAQAQAQLQQQEKLIQELDQAIQGMTRDLEAAKSSQEAERIKLGLDAQKLALEQEKARFDMQLKAAEFQAAQTPPPAAPVESGPDPRMELDREKMERQFDLEMLDRLARLEEMERAEALREAAEREPPHDEHAEEALLREMAARIAALEASAPKHDEDQEEARLSRLEQALTGLAAAVQGTQTVGVERTYGADGKLTGGIVIKANGARVPVSLG